MGIELEVPSGDWPPRSANRHCYASPNHALSATLESPGEAKGVYAHLETNLHLGSSRFIVCLLQGVEQLGQLPEALGAK